MREYLPRHQNPLLPLGKGRFTPILANPIGGGGAQFDRREVRNDSDATNAVDPDYKEVEARGSTRVLLVLLDEDTLLEEFIFFFIADLIDDGDGFMAIK